MSITRRQFLTSTGVVGVVATTSACSRAPDADSYDAAVARTWDRRGLVSADGAALHRELVRYATLAPSSHNTQCWNFAIDEGTITIHADLSRRCPAVDPDDHHVFVSLGCATENLVQAALAHGRMAEVSFDSREDAVRVTLSPTSARTSPSFDAISARQCTRSDYDGTTLTGEELELLRRAADAQGVRVMLMSDRPAMEGVLDAVIQANTEQMADTAFIKELKTWIRFNGRDAVRTGDGLFSVASGNPAIPAWLGDLAFGWFFTQHGENDKYARQIRSSAGIAVFVGETADKASWVEVGRSYERFALQATALGIRNAFLNQPVEVRALRPRFAEAIGLAGRRPDLVVRFGRGPLLPRSLRRPVQDVMV